MDLFTLSTILDRPLHLVAIPLRYIWLGFAEVGEPSEPIVSVFI